mmetsp:Transcript_32374/g.91738  ORF Transcript_32374/g.91738 Transcript_32374/m.91738 type:complete len:262 (-) Transcript_32374:51-836(-)
MVLSGDLPAQPPVGRSFAMAYPRSVKHSPMSTNPAQSRVWEELRKEARKLEGEIDVKLAAYAKLCAGYDAAYGRKHESSLGQDQLAASKTTELEDLLRRLSDVNEAMSSAVSGGDARAHTLARHRDIHHDYTQEFRRLGATLGAARDRSELLAGHEDSAPLLGVQVQGSSGALLRERTTLGSTNAVLDDVMGTASAVAVNLGEQRRIFDGVGNKLMAVGAKFPVLNGLLNAIRRKKSKDTIILSAVIAACALFTIIYWLNK